MLQSCDAGCKLLANFKVATIVNYVTGVYFMMGRDLLFVLV